MTPDEIWTGEGNGTSVRIEYSEIESGTGARHCTFRFARLASVASPCGPVEIHSLVEDPCR